MKNLLSKILVLCNAHFLLVTFSFAQTNLMHNRSILHNANANNAHKHFINYLLQRQSEKFVQKRSAARTTSALAERLVWQSTYNIADSGSILDPIGITDSAHYKYSGDRASLFNYNTMLYDNTYSINGSQIFGFGAEIGFPDRNDAPNLLCDSAWYWQVDYIDSPFNLVFYDLQYSSYDSNNNIACYTDNGNADSTTYEYDNRYINTFDSNNNITTSLAMSWDYGVWDTSEYRVFIYDSNKHVIEDSTSLYSSGSWSPEETWFYNYDDSGNIIQAFYYTYNGSSRQELYIYTMTYYSDNSIQTDSVSTDTGSAWIPVYKDSFGYTTGINYATYWKENTYDTSQSYFIVTKHISSLDLPDTMYTTGYHGTTGAIVSGAKDVFLYDSYQEPTIDYRYNLKIDTSTSTYWYDTTIDYIHYYRYELYDRLSHTIVQNTSSPIQNITVYPNPATNTLYFCYSPQDQITITLFDITGRTMAAQVLQSSTSASFNVEGYSPGIYMYQVTTNTNTQSGKVLIGK